jgi:hypothetical protein
MSETPLTQKSCQPCEGGTEPLASDVAQALLEQTAGWTISEDGTTITREFKFKDFYQTVAFINALARWLGWPISKTTTQTLRLAIIDAWCTTPRTPSVG